MSKNGKAKVNATQKPKTRSARELNKRLTQLKKSSGIKDIFILRRDKVINRPVLDYSCPVDVEVVKVLQEYANSQGHVSGELLADMELKTLKKVRRDVFKSIPGILDRDVVEDGEVT